MRKGRGKTVTAVVNIGVHIPHGVFEEQWINEALHELRQLLSERGYGALNFVEDVQLEDILDSDEEDPEAKTAEAYVLLGGEQLQRAETVLRQAFNPAIVRPGTGMKVCPQTRTLVGFVWVAGAEQPISHQITPATMGFILG